MIGEPVCPEIIFVQLVRKQPWRPSRVPITPPVSTRSSTRPLKWVTMRVPEERCNSSASRKSQGSVQRAGQRYIYGISPSLSLSTALCFSLCFHDRDKLATLTNDARFRSVVYVPCKLVIHERLLAPSSPPSLFEYVAFKYRGNRGMRRIHPWRILKERKSRRFDENIIKFSRILG